MACTDKKNESPEKDSGCAAGYPIYPDYLGRVAYIMDGDYASFSHAGLFVIVAQDDTRVDAVPLVVGYEGKVKRFSLRPKREESDNGRVRITPAASLTQVRDDDELVLDWARRQYIWGITRPKNADGKLQWCEGVYQTAIATAEMVTLMMARRALQRKRAFDEAMKSWNYQRAYGG